MPDITYLGRWHSDLVFSYAEEAWETRPCNIELKNEPEKTKQPPAKQLNAGALAETSGPSSAEAKVGAGLRPEQDRPPGGGHGRQAVGVLEDEMRMAVCSWLLAL